MKCLFLLNCLILAGLVTASQSPLSEPILHTRSTRVLLPRGSKVSGPGKGSSHPAPAPQTQPPASKKPKLANPPDLIRRPPPSSLPPAQGRDGIRNPTAQTLRNSLPSLSNPRPGGFRERAAGRLQAASQLQAKGSARAGAAAEQIYTAGARFKNALGTTAGRFSRDPVSSFQQARLQGQFMAKHGKGMFGSGPESGQSGQQSRSSFPTAFSSTGTGSMGENRGMGLQRMESSGSSAGGSGSDESEG